MMFITEVVKKSELSEKLQEVCDKHETETFIRKYYAQVKEPELKEGEKAEITYVSTRDIDRDSEIMLPSGCDLKDFNKAKQVFWGHATRKLPIGSDQWIKTDNIGVLAKILYADTDFANDVWKLVKGGHLKTSSVGFIPIKWVNKNDEGWTKLVNRLHKSGHIFDQEKVKRIYTKWILLEHSKVGVAANPNALTQQVAKGLLKLSSETLEELGIPEAKKDITLSADEEIKEWLKTCQEEGWEYIDHPLKPYPNEHACRLHPPENYSRFARNNNRFGDGIHAIFGRRKTDGKSELQAIRFDKTKFTVAQAKKWCKDHDHTCKPFEPATEQSRSTDGSICDIEPPANKNTPVIIQDVERHQPVTIIKDVVSFEERATEEATKILNRKLGKV